MIRACTQKDTGPRMSILLLSIRRCSIRALPRPTHPGASGSSRTGCSIRTVGPWPPEKSAGTGVAFQSAGGIVPVVGASAGGLFGSNLRGEPRK